MPTYDEDGRVVPMRPDLFVVSAAEVLRGCAIDAHDDWQAAITVSIASQTAARAAIGTGREAYAFDKAAALHEAAKRLELTFTRAREKWFAAAPDKAAIYRRTFKFRNCL
jgi:hypothetical protein